MFCTRLFLSLTWDDLANSNTMDSKAPLFIVTGNIKGKFQKAIEFIKQTILKHGPIFDAWFCLGDMLHQTMTEEDRKLYTSLVDGSLSVGELPIYFLIRDRIDGIDARGLQTLMMDSSKSTSKAKILPATGTLKLPNGTNIAFVSGLDDLKGVGETVNSKREVINREAVERISGVKEKVDILFTFEWPLNICAESNHAPLSYSCFGATAVASLAQAIRPKYIFSIGEGIFFEREPFKLKDDDAMCRFISLGGVDDDNERWHYAFQLKDRGNDNTIQCTPSPYQLIQADSFSNTNDHDNSNNRGHDVIVRPNHSFESEKTFKDHPAAPSMQLKRLPYGYVCRICNQPGHHIRDCQEQKSKRTMLMDDCWFCLANPSVKRELVVDIGTLVYLALPKEPLTDNHLLIIPIEHVSGLLASNNDLAKEIDEYKNRLGNIAKVSNRTPVFATIQLNPNHHWHQAHISIPSQETDRFKDFLIDQSKALGYLFEQRKPVSERFVQFSVDGLDFSLDIPFGSFFPADFARRIISEFLAVDDSTRIEQRALVEMPIIDLVKKHKDRLNK